MCNEKSILRCFKVGAVVLGLETLATIAYVATPHAHASVAAPKANTVQVEFSHIRQAVQKIALDCDGLPRRSHMA